MYHQNSLDTLCASLAYAIGIAPPACAADANPDLNAYIDSVFGGEKADRIVMYNPDAIATWVYEKYSNLVGEVKQNADIELPLLSVMPSVTPVCFGTMYTGAQPSVHGIQRYEKPIIRIDTLFDALIRAGKKPAIISYGNASLSNIYLDRPMDYYLTDLDDGTGGIDWVNAVASKLILRDEHDFIVIYNGNYDSKMHKYGPESVEALAELRTNAHIFSMLSTLIKRNWQHHNTLLGFAMDHGCHEIDGGCGSHGLDMEEDLNITHLYKGYARQK